MKPILTADVRVFYAAKSGTYTTRDRRFTGVAGGLDIGVSATWKWSSDPFFFNKRHIPVSKPPTSQFSHPGACVVLFVVRRWCEIEMACLVVLSPLFCDFLVPFPISSSAQAQQLEISLSWCNVATLGWSLPSTRENLQNRLTKSMLGNLEWPTDIPTFHVWIHETFAEMAKATSSYEGMCSFAESFVGTSGIQVILKLLQDVSQKQNGTNNHNRSIYNRNITKY